ncbi:MAG: dihydropteroate synthase [Aliishimia sp.]
MKTYIRPLVQVGTARPEQALSLAGGWGWFTHVERLHRDGHDNVVPVSALSDDALVSLTSARANILDLNLSAPVIMGILNVTPDSFSDGGQHEDLNAAVRAATRMADHGAHLLDVGGESTRPGAALVPIPNEIQRTAPVIKALRSGDSDTPISIDTRKAEVAKAALDAGANLVNDVAGFTFDPDLAPLCAQRGVPICVMHAQGDPKTMQKDPTYDNVLLDVYDFLEERIHALVALGIPKDQIIADPGIGFGKTQAHNLIILKRLSLFHSLGVPILLGASRKRFIGTLGNVPEAQFRAPGSIAVALAALEQGVQFVRVHDVAETRQAIALWTASRL